MLSERQTRLQAVLDRLREQANLQGAVLVSRDGFCIMNRLPRLPAAETFSAMSAMVLGAAEAALAEMGEEAPSGILIETRTTRMAVVAVSRELALVALASRGDGSEAPRLLERARDAAEELLRTLQS